METCKVYKKWQNHFYWSHMDPTNVKFFVKMEASSRRNLSLPRKFAKNFKGKISKTVKLKVPSGRTWQIEVLRTDNTICLRSGWRDFVTANKIVENDFLVFKYTGSSSFDVVIFDQIGNEKAALLITSNEETESEMEKTSSDSGTSVHVFIPPEKIEPDRRNGEGTSRYVRKKENKALSDKPYHIPITLKLSVAQENMANKMASATQPGSKLFLKMLSSSDVTHYLKIPNDFARRNLEERIQSVSLMLANQEKVFPAQYIYNGYHYWFGCGWAKFALGNNLKERDLCLFEVKKLDHADQLAVIVHVSPRAN